MAIINSNNGFSIKPAPVAKFRLFLIVVVVLLRFGKCTINRLSCTAAVI